MTDTLQILSKYQDYLWPHLKQYLDLIKNLPEFCQIPSKYKNILDFHFQLSSEYSQRKGKYIRPILLLLTAESLGCDKNKALNTAIAMQLSEDWILNHDDIEDNSQERRGLPTLHRQYGFPLALNAGDAIHNLTWRVLNDNQEILGPVLQKKVADEFFTMINRTIIGQTVEIKWAQENCFDLSLDDVLFILESKTGYYTIAGPMRLGAIIAGANDEQLKKIYNFGIILGRVFQIKDDLLDLTSDFRGLKKQQGNDIYEGKRTVMLIHLLNHLDSKNKTKLEKILLKSRQQKNQSEVNWVISQMKQNGSLEYSKKLVQKFTTEAQKFFNSQLQFFSKEPFKSELISIIDFITNREY